MWFHLRKWSKFPGEFHEGNYLHLSVNTLVVLISEYPLAAILQSIAIIRLSIAPIANDTGWSALPLKPANGSNSVDNPPHWIQGGYFQHSGLTENHKGGSRAGRDSTKCSVHNIFLFCCVKSDNLIPGYGFHQSGLRQMTRGGERRGAAKVGIYKGLFLLFISTVWIQVCPKKLKISVV